MGLYPATPTFGNKGLSFSTPVTLYPSRLSRRRTDSRSLFSIIYFSFSFSLRVPRSLADSLAPRSAPLLRAPLLVCLSLVLLSQYLPSRVALWYGMVGTVAGDGAPRSLSVVRSSGVCWTRPFRFYDSSLVVLRPFLLPMFHPSHALCVVFVAERCLLRYWLGFYLNWQLHAMFHNVSQIVDL